MFSGNSRRLWIVSGLLLSAVVAMLLWPRDVLITPPVRVEVVDQDGRPLAGISMTRSSAHYSVERISVGEDVVTDERGLGIFAARRVRMSRATEWMSAARKFSNNVDTGLGARSWVIVALPEAGPMGVPLFLDASSDDQSSWRCVVGSGCSAAR